MSTEILDARADEAKWHRALGELPEALRDVYYFPEYIRLHLFSPGSRAVLIVFRRAERIWLQPCILEPITHIADTALDRTWCDLDAPYGYTGPLANTGDIGFLSEAHSAFEQWCLSADVVAQFVRFHPILKTEQWIDSGVEVRPDRETVSLNLNRLTDGDLPFNANARNMLRRAERAGVEVRDLSPDRHFDQFVDLYLHSMRHMGADRYYHFGISYFEELADLTERTGWLLAALQDSKWIAASIFLRGSALLHYHLSATDDRHRVPGATNLLLLEAGRKGLDAGLERLHLGGGRTSETDDSLLKFKRSMATDSHMFCIGKRVFLPDVHRQLRALWEKKYPSLVERFGQRLLCYHVRPNSS